MNILLLCQAILISLVTFVVMGCKQQTGELHETAGYTPVEARIEEVHSTVVMKKGVVWVKVSYKNLSSQADTAMVNLGRYPDSFFKKGDCIRFYIHPDEPAILRYTKEDLMLKHNFRKKTE